MRCLYFLIQFLHTYSLGRMMISNEPDDVPTKPPRILSNSDVSDQEDDSQSPVESLDAIIDTVRVRGIRFVHQTTNELGIVWKRSDRLTNYQTIISDGYNSDPEYVTKSVLEARPESVNYGNLQPASIYWITVFAEKEDGEVTQPYTIKVHTLTAAPVSVRTIDFSDECVTLEWDNPNQVREQVHCVARVQKAKRDKRDQECIGISQNMVQICNFFPGTSWDINIWYTSSKKKSNTYTYRFTMKPQPVPQAAAKKITMLNEHRANIQIAWDWPENPNFWGAIKISFSPPPADALTTTSPYFITDRRIKVSRKVKNYPNNQFTLYNLHQGTFYTICISLTKGPLESIPTCFNQAIPKIMDDIFKTTPDESALKEVKRMTCRIPLGLYPRKPSAIIHIAELEPFMTIAWDHSETKIPEHGYKLIVTPQVDDAIQLPMLFDIIEGTHYNRTADKVSFDVKTQDFNPLDDFIISIIALHNERDNDAKPNGPEFVARIVTGKKKERNDIADLVEPDACCGNFLYSTQIGKLCCCDKLYDDMSNQACCGNIVYDKRERMCCDPGLNGEEPVLKPMGTGCNFGVEIINSAGVVNN